MIKPYTAVGLIPTVRGIRKRADIKINLEHLSHLVKAASWLSSLDLPVRLIAFPEGALQAFNDEVLDLDHVQFARECAIDIPGEETEAHPIIKRISNDQYLRLARESSRCPGLVLRAGTFRKYPYGRAAAHAMGVLTSVARKDLETDESFDDPLRKYEFTDVIGRGGLEGLCENVLRGTRGQVLRRSGRADEIVHKPVPGRDVRCTIDVEHVTHQVRRENGTR